MRYHQGRDRPHLALGALLKRTMTGAALPKALLARKAAGLTSSQSAPLAVATMFKLGGRPVR